MRLILMRHAKSDWSMDQPDHARPLNNRGVKSARAMGDWLRDNGHLPGEVLCSTATRTRQTLDLLDIDAPVRFERGLYHAAPQAMLEVLRGARADSVLMIGHNPGIAYLAGDLVKTAPDHPRFGDYPTCATLVAEFDLPGWDATRPGNGRALEFVIPRELIG